MDSEYSHIKIKVMDLQGQALRNYQAINIHKVDDQVMNFFQLSQKGVDFFSEESNWYEWPSLSANNTISFAKTLSKNIAEQK